MNGPRNVAGPVVRGTDFWGRKAEVQHLWQLLERGSVLLTGPRRHGKSSLMYAVHDNPAPGFSVILLDVEWVESPEEFLTTMAAELLAIDKVRKLLATVKHTPSFLTNWLGSVVDEVGLGVGDVGELKIRLRGSLTNTQLWPDLATQMLGTLRALPERTVLIIDEFPIMISNMLQADSSVALRFLRWFRTFRQSPGTERLTFLLGGSTNIEPRLEELRSEAILGDLQRFRMMPFDPPKAQSFVNELLREEGLGNDAEIASEITSICRSGVPYYLQVTVSECLAQSRRSSDPLDKAKVRQVYEEHVIGPMNRHRFSHYHTRLKSYYREYEEPARVVLAHLCISERSIGELKEYLRAAGYDASLLEHLLILLEADYYITRDNTVVKFADELLRDWWKRNSTPPRAV